MMFGSINFLARMIDGEKLREYDYDFDDRVADEFSSATYHLGTILCEEADGIYEAVIHKMKVEYVRDLLKQPRIVNDKFLDLATEMTFVSQKAFFDLVALHKGNFTDDDYVVWNMECEHENQLEAEWLEFNYEAKSDCLWIWMDIEADKAKDWARRNLPSSVWRQILKQGEDGDQFYPDDEFGLLVLTHINEPWAFDAAISGKQYEYPDYEPSLLNSLKYKQPFDEWL